MAEDGHISREITGVIAYVCAGVRHGRELK